MLYEYNELSNFANPGYVKENVALSEMTNKDIADIQARSKVPWFNGGYWLKIWFDEELSQDDKAILDSIVTNSIGKTITTKTRAAIMGEIYNQAEPVTQLPRLMGALNTQAVFIVALDNLNFDLARLIIQQLKDAEVITADDQTLVNGIIPVSKWV